MVLLSPAEAGYEVDINRRCSVSRLLTPEFLNLSQNDYLDITPQAMETYSPRHLRSSLIDVRYDSDNALSFIDDTRQRVNIAVTPHEYILLARNVRALGRASGMKTLAARPRDKDFTPHTEAAGRATARTYEGKFLAMGRYVNNVLVPRQELIRRFKEAARHPGLARFSDEGDMRTSFETLRSGVLSDALLAVRLQRHWSPAEAEKAEKAVMKQIVFDREANRHLSNFRGLLNLLDRHTDLKLELFRTRGWELKRRLEAHE